MTSDDLMPVPLHVQIYAEILTRPMLASALLATPLAVPMYFLFPLLISVVPGGFASEMWYSLRPWWRFFLTWFANVVTLHLYIRRPY